MVSTVVTDTFSQVKFILPTCKTKADTGGKRRKTLRSPKSAARLVWPKNFAFLHFTVLNCKSSASL